LFTAVLIRESRELQRAERPECQGRWLGKLTEHRVEALFYLAVFLAMIAGLSLGALFSRPVTMQNLGQYKFLLVVTCFRAPHAPKALILGVAAISTCDLRQQ
jgi:hypothetical protein